MSSSDEDELRALLEMEKDATQGEWGHRIESVAGIGPCHVVDNEDCRGGFTSLRIPGAAGQERTKNIAFVVALRNAALPGGLLSRILAVVNAARRVDEAFAEFFPEYPDGYAECVQELSDAISRLDQEAPKP